MAATRERLEAILGRKMTKLIGNDEVRLERVLKVVRILYSYESDRRLVQAWLMGLNPKLDDRSPMRLLRDGDQVDFRAVLDAARSDAMT